MNQTDNPVRTLESFFERVDAGTLFEKSDPGWYRHTRGILRDALMQALVWQRPLLAETRGIDWPYRGFSRRKAFFESASRSHRPEIRREAEIFLALLPFPGQWHRLNRAENADAAPAEISDYLGRERRIVTAKLEKKARKPIRLRNFCQVLKKPCPPDEKGVLRIFSLPYLVAHPGLLGELSRHWRLYIEPAAGVVFRHTWMRHFRAMEEPPLFGLGSEEDAAFVRSQGLPATTPLCHGDFLNDRISPPENRAKRFDIVFNGLFDEMDRKRHRLMLELLGHPLLAGTTALFLGRGKPENVAAFREMAVASGADGRIRVVANVERREIPGLLSSARMGVHLALHENGCRAVYEYFRSGLPCVISEVTGGMNMGIINTLTGVKVPDRELPRAIRFALDHEERFRPREWFLANSGSIRSSRRLNGLLRSLTESGGAPWNSGIVPITSSGADRYLEKHHYAEFAPQFDQLDEIFRSFPDLPLKIARD